MTHGLDESVYLADRIALMTARPGRIKQIVEVPLARPRDRTAPEFGRVMREVNAELRSEVMRSLGAPPEPGDRQG